MIFVAEYGDTSDTKHSLDNDQYRARMLALADKTKQGWAGCEPSKRNDAGEIASELLLGAFQALRVEPHPVLCRARLLIEAALAFPQMSSQLMIPAELHMFPVEAHDCYVSEDGLVKTWNIRCVYSSRVTVSHIPPLGHDEEGGKWYHPNVSAAMARNLISSLTEITPAPGYGLRQRTVTMGFAESTDRTVGGISTGFAESTDRTVEGISTGADAGIRWNLISDIRARLVKRAVREVV